MSGMEGTPVPSQVRSTRLRYPGVCAGCGRKVARGLTANYDAATKEVWCLLCDVGTYTSTTPGSAEPAAPVAPLERTEPIEPAPIDSGIAGGSAQREHDRRAKAREVRVKGHLGDRLGGVAIKLVPERQSTHAWAKGAKGERELAAALENLPGIVALHDRKLPRTMGNIDHLIVAPAGVFVVDAKAYDGALRIRDRGGLLRTDERLYVDGRDCSKLADGMAWQAEPVSRVVRSEGCELPVTSVLCFIGAEWPLLFRPKEFRGVRLASPKSLRKLLVEAQMLDQCGDRSAGPCARRGISGEVAEARRVSLARRACAPPDPPRSAANRPSASPERLTMVDTLALLAATWGVLMATAPILQIRRMLVRRSSADVSIAYLGVLEIGFVLWVAYGLSVGNPALVIPNSTALVVGSVLIFVAWRFKGRSVAG